jgi:hypothetical protein
MASLTSLDDGPPSLVNAVGEEESAPLAPAQAAPPPPWDSSRLMASMLRRLQAQVCASVLPVAKLHRASGLSANSKTLLTSLIIDVAALTLMHAQVLEEGCTLAALSAGVRQVLPPALAEACLREGEQAVVAFTATLPAVALAKSAAAAAAAASSAAAAAAYAAGGWQAWRQVRRLARQTRQAQRKQQKRIASATVRAGLAFSVDTVDKLMRHCLCKAKPKLAVGAPCLLAGVLQCLLGTILSSLGAREGPLVRTRDIYAAMWGHSDLCQLVPPAETPPPT